VSVSTPKQQGRVVRVYHAGSLNAVIGQDVGPAFTAATGLPVESRGGASLGWLIQGRHAP
jgi:ABC-type molybdate transport system substrate-binding protein